MSSVPGLLTLTQWLSPAFPTGGFAYSHGLEWMIAEGGLKGADALRDWLSDILRFGSGRQDAILLSLALRDGADHAALDGLARALCPSAERLTETLDQGRSFARTVAGISGRDLPPRVLPIAVGEAARVLDLPREQVIALYLHAFIANLVSVGIRFLPLGQTEGQAVLAALHPLIEALAAECVEAGEADLGSVALGADLAAMRHETMDVRIFRT